jgi:hypothetical protein
MKTVRLLGQLAVADFRERTRRYSFLITLVCTIYAAYIFLPANYTNYATLYFKNYRGIYNSAWVGTLVAVMTTTFFSLAGFYLTKNTLTRDRQTGVGQIIAATPVGKFTYLTGKAISNFLLLGIMVGVLIVAAGIMQIIRAEDTHIDIVQLILPFCIITLPSMMVVSAIAVLFESVPQLRGGFGNVLFFFLWMFALSSESLDAGDVLGFNVAFKSMQAETAKVYPDYTPDLQKMNLGFSIHDNGDLYHLKTFVWNGTKWAVTDLFKRLLSAGMAFALLILSSLTFDRFDSAASQVKLRLRRKKKGVTQTAGESLQSSEELAGNNAKDYSIHLSRLTGMSDRSYFGRMFIAEIKLIVKGISGWWLIVAAGLFIVGVSVPLEGSRQIVLPLTWLWPILLWSKTGTRESRYRTDQLIFSTAHSIRRQLPALWLAAVIITMLTGSGIAIRLFFGGEWQALGAWTVASFFIPTFALMLGVWSGGNKLFEIIYLLVWYMGPWSKLPILDFMASSDEALKEGVIIIYVIVTAVFFGIALIGRKRQLAM